MVNVNPFIQIPNSNAKITFNQIATLIQIANQYDAATSNGFQGNQDGFQLLRDVLGREALGQQTDLRDSNRDLIRNNFPPQENPAGGFLNIYEAAQSFIDTILTSFTELAKGGNADNQLEVLDLQAAPEEEPLEIIPADTRPVPPDNRPLAVIEAEHKYEEAANNVGNDFAGVESAIAAKQELDDVTGYFDQLGQAIDQAKATGDFETLHALVPDQDLFNQVLKDHDIQPAPVVDAHQNTQDAINNVTSDFVGLDSAIAAHEEEVAVDDYFTALGKATEKAKQEGNTNALFNPETGTGLVSYEQAVQFANENGIAPPNINIDLNGAV